jgi:hypothetical protein
MVQFSDGVSIRAQIDGEVVKGLTLANGGGAVALIAMMPTLLEKYPTLALATLWGLLGMFFGLIFAILHNRYRRHCSLAYESAWRQNTQPTGGALLWIKLKTPRVCGLSELFMWMSLIGFLVGGVCVMIGGLLTLY